MAEKRMTKVKSNLSRQNLNGTKGSEVRIVRIDRLIAQSIQYSMVAVHHLRFVPNSPSRTSMCHTLQNPDSSQRTSQANQLSTHADSLGVRGSAHHLCTIDRDDNEDEYLCPEFGKPSVGPPLVCLVGGKLRAAGTNF